MTPDPLLGVFLHWVGGFASASFYVPYRRVRGWSWETYWLAGGVFSWIIAPTVVAFWLTNDLSGVLGRAPTDTLFRCYVFGVLWGLGGLTFGLTVRYLGFSLGMAVALGYCAAFGTLIPPIFLGQFHRNVLGTQSGLITLVGVAICVVGIGIAGLAGLAKERYLGPEQSKATVKEFNLRKGLAVATFSGIMSSCFSFGLMAGQSIRELTVQRGTPELWQGLPVLVVVLLGGFSTNAIWCLILSLRKNTLHEYFALPTTYRLDRTAILSSNYGWCALAGAIWYLQFFFYSMAELQMGAYRFSSWTLHMASIMIFGSLWGLALKEWKGAGSRAICLLAVSIAVLVGSTVVVGYGNHLGSSRPQETIRTGRNAAASHVVMTR